jgi:hypothetical protein
MAMAQPVEVTDIDADIADFIKALPAEYIECRERGHAWKRAHRNYYRERTEYGEVLTRRYNCRDCTTSRQDAYHPLTMDLVSRSYDYPEGYLTRGISVSRREVRQFESSSARNPPRNRDRAT